MFSHPRFVAAALLIAAIPLTSHALSQVFALSPEGVGDAQSYDHFGWSVAMSGDTIAIGANFDDNGADWEAGAAYVYVRSGANWVQQAKLVSTSLLYNTEQFGTDVDLDGDTLVVGACRDLGKDNALDRGSAYVFTRSAGQWGLLQKLVADDNSGVDFFGCAVSISGDTIAIGAFRNSNVHGTEAGAVYIFDRAEGTWSFITKLLADNGAAYDEFGHSVSLDGDLLAVGATMSGFALGPVGTGSAYVFRRSMGAWTQLPELQPEGLSIGDNAGLKVAVSGGTVMVGAPHHNPNGSLPNAGAVFVYDCAGSSCTIQTKLTGDLTAASAGDLFGSGIAVDGDRAVIGAPLGNNLEPVPFASGIAYYFTRSGSTWNAPTTFTEKHPADVSFGENFGGSVALDGDLVVVGAIYAADPITAVDEAGAAFVISIERIFSDGFELP